MGPRSLFTHIVRQKKLLVKPMLITLRVQLSFHVGISLGLSSAPVIQRICGYVLSTIVSCSSYLLGKQNQQSFEMHLDNSV